MEIKLNNNYFSLYAFSQANKQNLAYHMSTTIYRPTLVATPVFKMIAMQPPSYTYCFNVYSLRMQSSAYLINSAYLGRVERYSALYSYTEINYSFTASLVIGLRLSTQEPHKKTAAKLNNPHLLRLPSSKPTELVMRKEETDQAEKTQRSIPVQTISLQPQELGHKKLPLKTKNLEVNRLNISPRSNVVSSSPAKPIVNLNEAAKSVADALTNMMKMEKKEADQAEKTRVSLPVQTISLQPQELGRKKLPQITKNLEVNSLNLATRSNVVSSSSTKPATNLKDGAKSVADALANVFEVEKTA